MCSRAHSSLVMELETESQGSEKPVEDEGPVCIGGGKVSLEISTQHEEKGKLKAIKGEIVRVVYQQPCEE